MRVWAEQTCIKKSIMRFAVLVHTLLILLIWDYALASITCNIWKLRKKSGRSRDRWARVWSCVYYIITKSGTHYAGSDFKVQRSTSKVTIISSPFAWICRHVPVQNRDSRRIDRFSCQSHTSKYRLWILATLPDDYTIIGYCRNDVYPLIEARSKRRSQTPNHERPQIEIMSASDGCSV